MSWGQQPKESIVPNKNGSIDFQILDSATGYAVSSVTIKWDVVAKSILAALPHSGLSSSGGNFVQQLSPGEYVFEISAPGYQPMRTHFDIAGSTVHANINLDPLSPPQELRDDMVAPKLRDEFELVHGYIVDAITRRPLAGVQLHLQESGATATSDSRGYFLLYSGAASTVDASKPEDIPATDTLTAIASAYKVYTLTGLLHVPGSDSVIRIAMIPGFGSSREHMDHRPLLPSGALPDMPRPTPKRLIKNLQNWLSASGQAVVPSQSAQAATTMANISLPTSIRVGSNCTNGRYGCTTTNTYSLETYVQDGLDKEWISSWKTDSLKAGAVAYRSYGAWFVANPICATTGSSCPTVYDICNSTYCQAFNTTSAKPTVAAAQATVGVVLSSDGINIFFAEYSANTNGLYCPGGQTGQPASNWPCMLDPIATGSTGSGHGRGMSQWGSQYWARGQSYQGAITPPRDWRCILDHYYNANSNSQTVDPAGTGNPGVGTGFRTAFMQGQPTYGYIAYEANYQSNQGNYTGIRVASASDASVNYALVSPGYYPSWEPGGNRLVYDTGNGLAIINKDGTGQRQLTTHSYDYSSAWSPLGDKIAFCSIGSGPWNTDVWVINPDGSGLQQVTHGLSVAEQGYYETEDCYLRWSPDGTKIAFTGLTADIPYASRYNVYTMNSDGSNVVQLTNCVISGGGGPSVCSTPSWSPDGTKITFSDSDTYYGDNYGGAGLYVMNEDGSGITPVYQNLNENELFPQWSTDGKKIIFMGQWSFGTSSYNVWSINPDGTGQVTIIPSTRTYSPWGIDCSRCGSFGRL